MFKHKPIHSTPSPIQRPTTVMPNPLTHPKHGIIPHNPNQLTPSNTTLTILHTTILHSMTLRLKISLIVCKCSHASLTIKNFRRICNLSMIVGSLWARLSHLYRPSVPSRDLMRSTCLEWSARKDPRKCVLVLEWPLDCWSSARNSQWSAYRWVRMFRLRYSNIKVGWDVIRPFDVYFCIWLG